MAGVKFQKGSPEWYMFQDYWRLCQKFWIPEDGDKYWDDLTGEASAFWMKHKNMPLAKYMALAFIDSQDGQYRTLRGSVKEGTDNSPGK